MRLKHLLAVSGLLVCAAAGAATQVSVIVEGQIKPGVYGRVEVGNPGAPPPVWRPQPVIIAPQPQVVAAPVPVYVHVPPGHARNWRRHCHRYNACGHPVYFVKSAEYEPGYGKKKKHHHHGHKHGRDHDHDRDRDRDRDRD
jgi:hypothetical protein